MLVANDSTTRRRSEQTPIFFSGASAFERPSRTICAATNDSSSPAAIRPSFCTSPAHSPLANQPIVGISA